VKIINWNVNSLKAREPLVELLIKKENPQIICLQELKTDDKEIVNGFFHKHGYLNINSTQKSYNGVAIGYKNLNTKNIELKNLNKEQARNNCLLLKDYNIILLNCYFPNGNPIKTEKFQIKTTWMNQIFEHLKEMEKKYHIIITGDFNVIPTDQDAHDIKKYKNDALASSEARSYFRKYKNLDLIDPFEFQEKKSSYTFFDYKTYKFGKEEGIRIDFFLLSPYLYKFINSLKVLKDYRNMERPSDHCPILMKLNI
tara:strand:- start:1724 stop:2488 length:765 start_codon:yes stop_codon:yes gene_type:complete